MKRLLLAVTVTAFVLVLVSLTRNPHSPAHSAAGPQARSTQPDPSVVARDYLTALLTGDLGTAEAQSTALLAHQLSAAPLGPAAERQQPTSMELFILDQTHDTADIAVELRWKDGRLAALRVQLVLQDDGWRVAEVQR